MSSANKRQVKMENPDPSKRIKKECSYGENCFRLNPAHFREYSHRHLQSILDEYDGDGDYPVPDALKAKRLLIIDQLDVLVSNHLYASVKTVTNENLMTDTDKIEETNTETQDSVKANDRLSVPSEEGSASSKESRDGDGRRGREKRISPTALSLNRDAEYRPIVTPKRRPEQFLEVVVPAGGMAAKHAAAAPYYVFYTTIAKSRPTHAQPNSITFLEILDRSLGELRCSLQINFMVEPGWLLAQYYFAGYSGKRLTILYGDDCADMRSLASKKPNVDAHYVAMATPFGKHHTKMMLLCYEDGSLRVLVSTANLYHDDWENRTQGVFLVASVPGAHFGLEWGMTRAGSLLRQHCRVPLAENPRWPLIAQCSSIGSFGKEAKLWLTGDFLHHFTKIKAQPQVLSQHAQLQLVYPSLENVRQSHDGLLGGGCLPYSGQVHSKQTWLNQYLYQWRASGVHRDRAMPHIKTYARVSPDVRSAAYLLLTSANLSKAAWGCANRGTGALRIMSYEAGVLLLPPFVINKDFFPLDEADPERLVLPYDVPPLKYTPDMTPWVSDYLT